MPNWISMELDVVGSPAELDRFVAAAHTRRRRGGNGATFWFHRASPPGPQDRYETDDCENAMALLYLRTKTQARFSLNAAWYFPERFFHRTRRHWPALSFMCAVNHEAGTYGGLVACVGGEYRNQVQYQGDEKATNYQKRVISGLQKRWQAAIIARRPWVLFPESPWDFGFIPFDATFDDDFMFYFRTREEMAAFRKRYRVKRAARRGREGLVRLR